MLESIEFLAEYFVKSNHATSTGIVIFTAGGSSAKRLFDILNSSRSYEVMRRRNRSPALRPQDLNNPLWRTPPADGVTRVFIINRNIEDTIRFDIPYVDCIIDLGVTMNSRTQRAEFTSQNAVSQCLGFKGRLNHCKRYLLVPFNQLRESHRRYDSAFILRNATLDIAPMIKSTIDKALCSHCRKPKLRAANTKGDDDGVVVTLRPNNAATADHHVARLHRVTNHAELTIRMPDGSRSEYFHLDFHGPYDLAGTLPVNPVDVAALMAAREGYAEEFQRGLHRQQRSELLYALNVLNDEEEKYISKRREVPEHFPELRDRLTRDLAVYEQILDAPDAVELPLLERQITPVVEEAGEEPPLTRNSSDTANIVDDFEAPEGFDDSQDQGFDDDVTAEEEEEEEEVDDQWSHHEDEDEDEDEDDDPETEIEEIGKNKYSAAFFTRQRERSRLVPPSRDARSLVARLSSNRKQKSIMLWKRKRGVHVRKLK